VADDAPKGDVLRKDGLAGVTGDVNAFEAGDTRAGVTTNERARLH
jgi:hypothetical protein